MEKKQNKALAITLLAVVIMLGAGVWGVLYSQGWFVALVAFVTAFLAILVYGKFAEVTKTVYIVSGVVIVVLNIIASFLSIGITVAIKAECSLKIAFEAVFQIIGDYIPDLAKDGVLCIILTILGLVGVKKTYEQRKAKAKVNVATETTVAPAETTTTEEINHNEVVADATTEESVKTEETADETSNASDYIETKHNTQNDNEEK